MKTVYVVFGCYHYYPDIDNILFISESFDRASEFLENYDERKFDCYEIVEKELE